MTRAIVVGAGGQDGQILSRRLEREGAFVLGIERDRVRCSDPSWSLDPVDILVLQADRWVPATRQGFSVARAGASAVLVQIVMASRVTYGMAAKRQAPRSWARVHPWTRTPLEATAATVVAVLVLALWFPLVPLAKATSTILLVIYALVNLFLWTLKRRGPVPRDEGPCYPVALPIVGSFVCVLFLVLYFSSALVG